MKICILIILFFFFVTELSQRENVLFNQMTSNLHPQQTQMLEYLNNLSEELKQK